MKKLWLLTLTFVFIWGTPVLLTDTAGNPSPDLIYPQICLATLHRSGPVRLAEAGVLHHRFFSTRRAGGFGQHFSIISAETVPLSAFVKSRYNVLLYPEDVITAYRFWLRAPPVSLT